MPRPKGLPKTGGKKKGSKNKRTVELDKAAASGQTAIEFLLEVMRDVTKDIAIRLDAAKAVAPYLHARRAAEDSQGKVPTTVIIERPRLEDDDCGSVMTSVR